MKKSKAKTIDQEYPRFKFAGFGSQGTCFLRVRVRPDGIVVLCSQLLDYYGTSVTNAVEAILVSTIEQLQKDFGLDHLIAARPWWRFRTSRDEFIEQIVRRTVWVEHYPPGAGLAPAGSFALVAFDSGLHPVWNYVSKEVAAAECAVEVEFLKVENERLQYVS